ncbi:EAL domain-containing protein [Marinospirillum alkaliphilum]|uniref:PAS domain S-box-containing protein/diguanylate cyclase (GGDEF) domain-containing protein n=1 Tax=Marinospirillum alkaliphilum DSM 21637 TaxID=1122209 RepID=A0A1K1YWE6_9GAMM|nr:EAL domain-containing protein [Marinospirillum alkaliphilum]SFX65684.1 PAS domain S-box-containing protein/diguanylate cyclase (GGDEF) domain-containing protein [Marinospirillum alkaliphilum DSM 21637]
MRGLLLYSCWLLVMAFPSPPLYAEHLPEHRESLVLGVFAYRDETLMQLRYQPLVDYLTDVLPEYQVELRLLDQPGFWLAVQRHELDFVLTNPVHFISLREHNALSGALATLVRQEADTTIAALGGVIIQRRSDGPLYQLSDLAGKRIAITGQQYLGSFLAPMMELEEVGIHARQLRWLEVGQPHEQVVDAVLSGQADAGFIRTGILEAMRKEGRTEVDALRVINAQYLPGFPYVLSTRLYPEWPLVALPQVDAAVARKVASSLLALDALHPAAQAAGIAGFTIPADYTVVERVMRKLRLAPFDVERRVTLQEVWWAWQWPLMLLLGALILISMLALLLAVMNRKLASSRQQLQLAASVFANTNEAIYITDANNRVVDVNPAFERITGYSRAEMLGQRPNIRASGRQQGGFYEGLWSALEARGSWQGEIWNRRKSGEVYPEFLSISAVKDELGRARQYVAVFNDITQTKAHEAELYHIANYDLLTGLPNRRLLTDRLNHAVAHANRSRLPLVVCYLDLDDFKPVNDQYGHEMGDQLLLKVAQRLQRVMREDDTLARLGGDEFVLLLTDLPENRLDATVQRLLEAVVQPVQLGDASVRVSASMGLTLYPMDSADPDTLLRHADQAMYRAKGLGKNRYHRFDPELAREQINLQAQVQRLRQALTASEFVLHYQPKVNLATQAVIGVEALIRWQHPEQGLLPPAAFLPDLEGSDLEVPIGQWVLRKAVEQMAAWLRMGLQLPISVNISASHLLHPGFIQHLQTLLNEYPQVTPGMLEIEVLETAALSSLDQGRKVLDECHELGVLLSLDDFGTGYSSLAYFRNLPVDQLKIDRSFVCDMLDDPEDRNIVDSVVRLARAFRREVIAEGVETPAHARALLQMDCRLAQGYGIARPMPADQISAWQAGWKGLILA